MRKLYIALFLFFAGCISDPWKVAGANDEGIFFNFSDLKNYSDGGTTASLVDLLEKSEKSIECALGSFEADYFEKSFYQTGVAAESPFLQVADVLKRKYMEGIREELVWNEAERCHGAALYLQYPGAWGRGFSSSVSYEELYNHCMKNLDPLFNNRVNNPGGSSAYFVQSENVAQLEMWRQEGLPSHYRSGGSGVGLIHAPGLYFVNPEGVMKHNYCLVDNKHLWFSTTSLQNTIFYDPGFSFVVTSDSFDLFRKLREEMNLLKAGLWGKWKRINNPLHDYTFLGIKFAIFFGPHEKPFDELVKIVSQSEKVTLYSTFAHAPAASGNSILVDLLLKKIAKGNLKYLANSPINLSEHSLVSVLIDRSGCKNNPLNCNWLSLINSGADKKPADIEYQILLAEGIIGNKIVFYGSSVDSQDQKSDFSMVTMENEYFFNVWKEYFQKFFEMAYKIENNSANIAPPGTVVVSEILWRGAGSGVSQNGFLELYNNSDININIGNWQFSCSDDAAGLSASSFIVIPAGVEILPQSYLVVSDTLASVFNADVKVIDFHLSDKSRECILTDGAAGLTPVSGYFRDQRIQGAVMDKILDRSGDSVNINFDKYSSRTGVRIMMGGRYELRSMERNSTDAVVAHGGFLESWHTNRFLFSENHVNGNFRNQIFASPGSANSWSTFNQNKGVVINEINWMGSYDSAQNSYPEDEFVELYNYSNQLIDIGGWSIGCSSDIFGKTGDLIFTFPFGTVIGSGAYLTVGRSTGQKMFQRYDFLSDFSLNNNSSQCILTDGNYNSGKHYPLSANNRYGHYNHPLLYGSLKDMAGDRSLSFSKLGSGLNDSNIFVRRSSERMDALVDGSYILNWRSNQYLPFENSDIDLNFRTNSFSSPGRKNSVSK